MTTPDALADRLRSLSAALLDVSPDELTPEALLGDDLAVDSLAAIEWGMAVEDAFAILLPEDAWEYTRVYGQVEHLVRTLVARSARVEPVPAPLVPALPEPAVAAPVVSVQP